MSDTAVKFANTEIRAALDELGPLPTPVSDWLVEIGTDSVDERDGVEGWDAYGVVVLEQGDQHPLTVPELEGFQTAGERIDEPQMDNAFPGIDRSFLIKVDLAGSGGEHFACPVRREGRVGGVGKIRHPLPAPSGEIGHDYVFGQMQFRLVEDPPTPRTARVVIEGTSDLCAER